MALRNTRLTNTTPIQVFQATSQEVVTVIYLCNTSGSTVSCNVYAVSQDGSTGGYTGNQIYSNLELTANDTYVISTEKMILDALDEIEVSANIADTVTVTVSSFNMA